MHPPKLHQPTLRVTAMVAAVAVVSAVAATAPAPSGSLVRGSTRPVAAVSDQGTASTQASPQPVYGEPTTTTVVSPPPSSQTATAPGDGRTVLFNDPAKSVQLASPLASDGIPVTALEAYQDGANSANASHPSCHIPWPLLAGIGRVESDHGRYGGAVLRPDGTSTKPIIGIPLDGHGTEVVTDTDNGTIDGDPVYDHAVGPMQFIPSTWAGYGADGNGDGIKDPFNIFDAALAAADYLCVAGGNLSTTAGQTRAVLAYNHSTAYLDEVLALEHTYASGDPGLIIPAAPTGTPTLPKPGSGPTLPPVDPGPPLSDGSPTSTPTKHPKPVSSDTKHPIASGTSTPDPGQPSDTPSASSSGSAGGSSSNSGTPTDSGAPTGSSSSTCAPSSTVATTTSTTGAPAVNGVTADARTATGAGTSGDTATPTATGTPSDAAATSHVRTTSAARTAADTQSTGTPGC